MNIEWNIRYTVESETTVKMYDEYKSKNKEKMRNSIPMLMKYAI